MTGVQTCALPISENRRISAATELAVAEAVKGEWKGDNFPFDVLRGKVGIEIKTLQSSDDTRVNMKAKSRRHKEEYAAENRLKAYTVAVDYRSGGKPTVYYKKGLGAFSLSTMDRLTSIKELARVLK